MSMVSPELKLRRVQVGDCHLIWEWANTPEIREVSFEPNPIPWDRHQQWYAAKLRDPKCYFFLILDSESRPVGQVRLEESGQDEATISISLAATARGQGWGPQAIRLAAAEIFRTTTVRIIHAYIKPENTRSIRAFCKAGFQSHKLVRYKGQVAEHYILTREDMDGAGGE